MDVDTTALKDRVVVITGAARGIGRAYTLAFLAAGAKVVATDRSWDGADKPAGNDVLVADMDLTNEAQIDRTYAATLERFRHRRRADQQRRSLRQRDLFPPTGRTTTLETKDADWEKSFAVNVFGTLKVIRRFIKPMIEKRRGSIVSTVSSGITHHSQGGAYAALRPNSREMPYQSGKAALATMQFYLADEVAQHNVAVNIIIPGHTRTTGFDDQNRARLALGAKPGPIPLVPEHMVPLTLHLAAQDAASGVTGKMFDVVTWNIEHGLGGHERWADHSFSYEALMAK